MTILIKIIYLDAALIVRLDSLCLSAVNHEYL
jgi:hypothetical protein